MIEFDGEKITTTLCDMDFIERVWKKWGEYNEGEVDALWESTTSVEFTEPFLKEGFLVLKNRFFVRAEEINLQKVGHKEWIIEDASAEEMQEFVDEINGDVDLEEE